jgi:hypothetical protein
VEELNLLARKPDPGVKDTGGALPRLDHLHRLIPWQEIIITVIPDARSG